MQCRGVVGCDLEGEMLSCIACGTADVVQQVNLATVVVSVVGPYDVVAPLLMLVGYFSGDKVSKGVRMVGWWESPDVFSICKESPAIRLSEATVGCNTK